MKLPDRRVKSSGFRIEPRLRQIKLVVWSPDSTPRSSRALARCRSSASVRRIRLITSRGWKHGRRTRGVARQSKSEWDRTPRKTCRVRHMDT